MTKVNCREIPYSDLLLREEWRKKRVIILKRDSNTCNSCNNDFLNQFDNGFYNNATRTDVGKKNIIVVSSIKGLVIWPHEKPNLFKALTGGEIYRIYFEITFGNQYAEIYGVQKAKEENDDDIPMGELSMMFKQMRNKYRPISEDPEKYFAEKTKKGEVIWSYVKGLHVHHTYYQKSLCPWEYPNESLETYCWECHHKIHSTSKIPFYEKDGTLIGNLTSCQRCGGAGEIPEYRHVESGICFECRGAKYEELIVKDSF